jgi:hypothetical protein
MQGQLAFTARGSHTSRKAAERIASSPTRVRKVDQLAAAYREAGDTGLTDVEASELVMLPLQSVCSSRNALRQRGMVGRGGERMGAYELMVSVWLWVGPK